MAGTTTAGGYPAQLSFPESNEVANWRPLVHWLMVVPHWIILYVISSVSGIISFVAWFIILFTGKLPEGMANFMIMNQRYTARTTGFLVGLTEDYPPFGFDTTADDPGDHSITLSVQADLDDRNRLTVFFRIIMIIPLVVVSYIYMLIASVVAFVAWFAVLFTGRYPSGMRNFMIGVSRYMTRVNVYVTLITDEYPPFNTDA